MTTTQDTKSYCISETSYYKGLDRDGRLAFWTEFSKLVRGRQCMFGTCDWPRHARGLCKHHYTDVYNDNPFRGHGPYAEANLRTCKSKGCEKPVHGLGYCKSHHAAYRRVQDTGYPYQQNLAEAERKLAQAEAQMNRYRVWRYRQMLRINGTV